MSLPTPDNFTGRLQARHPNWLSAVVAMRLRSSDLEPTLRVLDEAEYLWGVTPLSQAFRTLAEKRGVSLYNYRLEHHFTGSLIVLNLSSRKVLMNYHPNYRLWLQLGGHDEGENHPLAVAAREGWEESGIDALQVCDWPVWVDPHPAYRCQAVARPHRNMHYDMCYLAITKEEDFVMSRESAAMAWMSVEQIASLVNEGSAQQRGLNMAQNAVVLFDALNRLNLLPDSYSSPSPR